MIPPPAPKQKIVVIVGPTAVGKTSLSIALAKAVHGEIVSADSRQVYRGLDSGSGKITTKEMEGVPHHLIDVADPKETFSAADYVRLARWVTSDVTHRGRVPILVGGTGFYIDALLGRVVLAEVPPHPALRSQLSGVSVMELQKKLAALDPHALERVDSKNPVRLMRAIEIATALGSVPKPTMINHSEYEALWIGLSLPLPELKKRIQARLTARLDMGMLEEARQLHKEGLSYERMESLGLEYRFMAQHLKGALSYEAMVNTLETEIFKYAKRQITWFKRNKEIHWRAPEDTNTAISLVQDFLNSGSK